MKLAEALLERANIQRDISRIKDRITNNALVQDGDEPAEDPKKLLPVYEQKLQDLQVLMQRINHTNAVTAFAGSEMIADAIAKRDVLAQELKGYREIYQALQISPNRYSQMEIRFVRTMDPMEIQKKIDELSKAYRELDTKLQGLNWEVDLI